MSHLLYRPDIDEVYDRLTTWWNGGDIGRPALQLMVKREEPLEQIPPMAEPEGWVTHYSTSSFDYRLYLAATACVHTEYLAEAVPCTSPDLGPNCLALYLGCQGVEQPGTVWFEPCIDGPEQARFEYDADNYYWNYTWRLARELCRLGRGRFSVSFPDLIEGLDTLAAMRGTNQTLLDLVERPDWVQQALERITPLYFCYYDLLYDLIKDERGGSHFWAWAPGRMAKFQCDFSAMISPAMFDEFMVPVLREMCQRVDYCMYHWDGPGAIPHHDHLLAIPELTMIQWTPGAGAPPVADKTWWPLYHKTVEAGKKVILLGVADVESARALAAEFGTKLKDFMISMRLDSREEARQVIELVSD